MHMYVEYSDIQCHHLHAYLYVGLDGVTQEVEKGCKLVCCLAHWVDNSNYLQPCTNTVS